MAKVAAESEPEKVTAENAHVRRDEHGNRGHRALTDENPCWNIDDLFADWNPYTGGEEQRNHRQRSEFAEKVPKGSKFIHWSKVQTNAGSKDRQCIVGVDFSAVSLGR